MHQDNRFILKDVVCDAVLLVEGIDDARFFEAFLGWLGKVDDVQVAQVGGKDRFRQFLDGPLKRANNFPRLRRLGIIRDADSDASAAFQSLCGSLTDAALPAPTQAWAWRPTRQGGLDVSVAILPDMSSDGNLEEVCLRSLKAEPELSCINDYIGCIARTSSPISAHHLAKAKIYTYLAAGAGPGRGSSQDRDPTGREKPGLRLGESAEKGIWTWDDPAFQQLKDWLLDLS